MICTNIKCSSKVIILDFNQYLRVFCFIFVIEHPSDDKITRCQNDMWDKMNILAIYGITVARIYNLLKLHWKDEQYIEQ